MPCPDAALSRACRRSALLALGLAAALPLTTGQAAAAAPSPAPSSAPSSAPTSAPTATPEDIARAAEQVATAEARVTAMQQQVEQTAAVLAEGTAKLDQGRAELERTKAEQVAAEAAAVAAAQRAADTKARVAVVVSASYRSPLPRTVQMALTAGPEEIVDVIVARHDLDRVQGDSQDLLRKATAAREEAEQARRYASSVLQAAVRQEAALAAEVDRLAAIARDSEATLAQAAAQLAAAQTDQQGVVAAAEAQERAREAERLAQAAAGSYVAATCAGMPTGLQVNGMLDPSTLCPLDDAPGHALRPDAAAAFNAMNAAREAEGLGPLCVGDSYRSYSAQVQVFASKPHLAAVPGSSNHGWGVAVDFSCGVQTFGSPEHQWMQANAGRFGWFHPDWAQAGGSRPEAWHWEFAA